MSCKESAKSYDYFDGRVAQRLSLLTMLLLAFTAHKAAAQSDAPLPGMHTAVSAYAFDAMARELDPVFEKIVRDVTAG